MLQKAKGIDISLDGIHKSSIHVWAETPDDASGPTHRQLFFLSKSQC